MKTYLTLSAIALAAAATLTSGTVLAQAKPATPEFTVTGNFGITSDYRFRGISQNNLDPAFQGGFDLAHSSGLYVGTWGSNVSTWTASKGSLELDLYGGYKTELAGIAVDLGAISYTYPGSEKSYGADTQEAYVGLGYGPITFKTSYVIGNNYFVTTSSGQSARGTMYYDLSVSYELMPKLVGSIHAGYLDYKNNATGDKFDGKKLSFADYNLGLAYDVGNGFTLGAKYFWNDAKAGTNSYAAPGGLGGATTNLLRDGFAVSLTKTF